MRRQERRTRGSRPDTRQIIDKQLDGRSTELIAGDQCFTLYYIYLYFVTKTAVQIIRRKQNINDTANEKL